MCAPSLSILIYIVFSSCIISLKDVEHITDTDKKHLLLLQLNVTQIYVDIWKEKYRKIISDKPED